jgi:hypothetical protein
MEFDADIESKALFCDVKDAPDDRDDGLMEAEPEFGVGVDEIAGIVLPPDTLVGTGEGATRFVLT